jgi:hypothetical protein
MRARTGVDQRRAAPRLAARSTTVVVIAALEADGILVRARRLRDHLDLLFEPHGLMLAC